jgi:hypothetical protein
VHTTRPSPNALSSRREPTTTIKVTVPALSNHVSYRLPWFDVMLDALVFIPALIAAS